MFYNFADFLFCCFTLDLIQTIYHFVGMSYDPNELLKKGNVRMDSKTILDSHIIGC